MAKKKTTSRKPRRDIYQEVTDAILKMLDDGTVPWRNPIARANGDGWPRNLESGKRYRGINVFLLAMIGMANDYDSDYWMTFKQAQAKGGRVRKGEKGALVTFWKLYDTKDRESGKDISVPVLRHYTVFNADQVDDVEPSDVVPVDPEPKQFDPIEDAQAIVNGFKDRPPIEHRGHRAVYRPLTDTVIIPEPERFKTREQYYATLFHELVHSTGHTKRLDRGLDTTLAPFGSPDYSREELVAEMGAAFLSAAAGISPPTIEQSAAYINGWKKTLKTDKRVVVAAAGAAQKAADWILGEHFFGAYSSDTAAELARTAEGTASASIESPKKQLDLF